MPGYRSSVQRVNLADHNTRLDLLLNEEASLARVAGTYTLTLVADPDCTVYGKTFPEELRVRAYTAIVTQAGNELTVTLSGATFHPNSSAAFRGQVTSPGLATFWLIDSWYLLFHDGDVVEQLSPETTLTIGGSATMSTSTLSGGLNGILSFQYHDEPSRSTCASSDHQFRMSR
jgi:hypothetical protein